MLLAEEEPGAGFEDDEFLAGEWARNSSQLTFVFFRGVETTKQLIMGKYSSTFILISENSVAILTGFAYNL